MPEIPNLHAVASMLLTVVALYLFSRERLRLEISSVGLISLLAMGFSLFPYGDFRPTEFFAGFGHEALIAVSALMVDGSGAGADRRPGARGAGAGPLLEPVALSFVHGDPRGWALCFQPS